MLLYGLGLKAIELEAEQSGKLSYGPDPEDTTEDICLDYLARMGPCGRSLAASLLCNRLLLFPGSKAGLLDSTTAPQFQWRTAC